MCLSARFNPENGNDCGTVDGVVGNGCIRVVGHDACPGDSGGGWYRPSRLTRTGAACPASPP